MVHNSFLLFAAPFRVPFWPKGIFSVTSWQVLHLHVLDRATGTTINDETFPKNTQNKTLCDGFVQAKETDLATS